MREEIQAEYDSKLKEAIDELEEYKQQIGMSQKDSEIKLNSQYQKQMNNKERLLYQLNGEKVELEEQAKHLEKLVQEKEEIIINHK